MNIFAYASLGYEGRLISVEVDLRRGIPGVDIVGLAGSAVREARERIRVAVRNSGLRFPRERILINLAPADIPKAGTGYDLPIAAAILAADGQIPDYQGDVLIMGELLLSGAVRPVPGVLSAVSEGRRGGIRTFVLPRGNAEEAGVLAEGWLYGAGSLAELIHFFELLQQGGLQHNRPRPPRAAGRSGDCEDFADLIDRDELKRALCVAVAGRHNLLLFGPPGSGKTMACRRIPSILPALNAEESIEIARIRSAAGVSWDETPLSRPFRSPHHSATAEGILGGGSCVRPGELSLAHTGVLFLDEAPEFRKDVLQSLREPLETAVVSMTRASIRYWYPADVQLVMAANPCPCGNLGRDERVCMCGIEGIRRHWSRLGSALLDRIDMRLPVKQARPGISGPNGLTSPQMYELVLRAAERQLVRRKETDCLWNSRLKPAVLRRTCSLEQAAASRLTEAAEKLGLSARACSSVLKVARTIADVDGCESIASAHVLEAVQYRRFGDGHYFWL